jgi:outer membrane protein TolC
MDDTQPEDALAHPYRPALSIPVFEGGRLQAQVRVADLQAHQAALALADSTTAACTDLVALFKALGGGWSERES